MAEQFRDMTAARQKAVLQEYQYQVNVANAEEFITRMTKKCFAKCVTNPGAALDNSEKRCTSMCMDRFIDSWNLVMGAYIERINKETQQKSG